MARLSDIDAAARGGVSRFGVRLACALLIAAAAGSASDRKLLGFAQALELGGFFLCSAAMTHALLARERPEATVIGHWDQAIAYGFVAMLAHFAIGVLR